MSKKTTSAAADTAVVTNVPVQNTPTPETMKQAAEAPAVQVPSTPVPETQNVATKEILMQEIPAAYADYKELPAVVAAPLGLNLRTGPAMNYGVLETLPDGAPVTVLPLPYGAEVKGWTLVVSESGTCGWVMTEFLAEPTAEE
ncbi:SH3 domain-containing protein [Oscillibacter sp.]|uniref:SH3 domain-containing protein n=1 Tax=Oscillibacter sp. TaxID=1945593 RepID=UPI003393C96B